MSKERDFVLARLALARMTAKGALDAIDDAVALFMDVEEDLKGEVRAELVDVADDGLGLASRLVQDAAAGLESIDPTEGEPDGDEEEE